MVKLLRDTMGVSEERSALEHVLSHCRAFSRSLPLHHVDSQAPAVGMKHIYLLSPIPYTFLHQRPQQLADNLLAMSIPVTYIEPCGFTEYLAGRKKGIAKLIVASLFYHVLGLLALVFRPLGGKPVPRKRAIHSGEKVEIVSLPLVIPQTRFNSRVLEQINASVYRQVLIRKVFRTMQPDEVSIALVENPYYGTVIREGDFSKLFYDCLDEISLFAGRASGNRYRSYEAMTVSLADAVFVTAKKLEDHISSLRQTVPVYRVPNGVDAAWFQEKVLQPSELLKDIPRPVVGYAGTLSSWLDYELIGVLAKSFPAVSFVFVGPLDLDSRIKRLEEYKNVYWLGRREYREIPSIIGAFNVCLIPFVAGNISQTTNPVKIYEYFSLGKPVVTTPLNELEIFRDMGLVYMAGSREGFVEGLREALEERDSGRQRQRRDIAAQNTWESHALRMVSLFDSPKGIRADS